MKASWSILVLAAMVVASTHGQSAPTKSKQSPAIQQHFDDVKQIRTEMERLSIEMQKLAQSQEENKIATGKLVAEAGNVASDATTAATSTETVATSDNDSKYILGLEIRPGYYRAAGTAPGVGAGADKWATENTVTLGVQFTKDTSFVYEQYVNTYSGAGSNSTVGLTPIMSEGAARILLNDLWTSEKLGLSLSYENRTLLPWDSTLRDRNRVFANRNYIKLKKTLGDNFAISLYETGIVYVHTTPNAVVAGALVNNEAFENRVYLIPEAKFIEGKLNVSLPMWISSMTRRDESNFTHQFIAWPEVTYAVASGVDVGVAYQTGSMVNPNFDGFDIAKGIDNGYSQLVLRASL